MKDIITICSEDMNTSLVFYRALFGQMPKRIATDRIIFEQSGMHIELIEKRRCDVNQTIHHFHVDSSRELQQMYSRVFRYLKSKSRATKCVVLDDTIALTDPDGKRWIVGLNVHASFDECYLENFNQKQL